VIKYLSVLSSEGEVEFVEIGPSKLWRTKSACLRRAEERAEERESTMNIEAFPMMDIDFHSGEDKTVYFSFRVNPDQICALMKRAKKCICKVADTC
jgi:hypothetical protein